MDEDNISFDIICSHSTSKKFNDIYRNYLLNIEVNDNSNANTNDNSNANTNDNTNDNMNSNEEYSLMLKLLEIVVKKELWKNNRNCELFENKFRIGDMISIKYLPDSQKYIEHYENESFQGVIIFTDDDNNNIFLIKTEFENKENIKNKRIVIKSLERENCHYFGMSRGYIHLIEKIEN
jgi:hypothetical protein